MVKDEISISQIEDLAELAGGYQDDFGKWMFRETDYLCRFADLILATKASEINNLTTDIQMLRTDLEAAELEIRELRKR
jgi:hypothetical protein